METWETWKSARDTETTKLLWETIYVCVTTFGSSDPEGMVKLCTLYTSFLYTKYSVLLFPVHIESFIFFYILRRYKN